VSKTHIFFCPEKLFVRELEVQRAIEHDMELAMKLPAHYGKPKWQQIEEEMECELDMSQCPVGWRQQGTSCFPESNYKGEHVSQIGLCS